MLHMRANTIDKKYVCILWNNYTLNLNKEAKKIFEIENRDSLEKFPSSTL